MEPYKLKAEIKEFILQNAKEHPELGCRKLARLIQEAFQSNISKSTVSSLLKSEGLNKVVGRRGSRPKAPLIHPPTVHKPEVTEAGPEPALGMLPFLEEASRNHNEAPLPAARDQERQECGIWFLRAAELCLGGMPEVKDARNPENIKAIVPQIFSELVFRSTEALAQKFILEDNRFFFLDAGCHTIWTTERIPERLSVGLYKDRTYLNESILSGRKPLILQAAPGFDIPTPALFDFIDAFQAEKPHKAIKGIELYSADNLLIDTIKFAQRQEKRYFIIGLWPWQYKNRDFGPSIRLVPINNTDNSRKLDIITNIESGRQSGEEIIGHYLRRWPILESGYQDFLDEIGHFVRSPRTKIQYKCPILPNNGENLTYEQVLSFWRLILNSYCQRHFFPIDYQELDFLVLQERFYHLRGAINSISDSFEVKFEPPEGFLYQKDLQYACQRVNEADIRLIDGHKLRFSFA
ncbi:helix-turn-helix domain-containing protein [bacterium]|nr:MAG: helix-turn-helix domain-containing protein [bacterium]